MEAEIEKQFRKQDTVKYKSEGADVKTLIETAKKLTQKPGRLLVIVNTAGDKVNVVVASSTTQNAGEVCRKICEKLGGGGGGSPTLAMGGGNAKDAGKILEGLSV